MNYARTIFICSILSVMNNYAQAQFRASSKSINLYNLNLLADKTKPAKLFIADQKQGVLQAPLLSGTGARPFSQTNSYWLTRMTTQSINDGKIGTTYFWDQQGNLRESRFFVEVGGKRKPGLKLVFPRR